MRSSSDLPRSLPSRRLPTNPSPARGLSLLMAATFCLATGLALGLVGGCAEGVIVEDAGRLESGGPVPATELRFENDGILQLTPSQNVTLRVALSRLGEPWPAAEVRLALEGRAHDGSLSEVRGFTDASGMLQVSLRASSVPASFRVRASAPGASPAYLPVGVSATGFGNLEALVQDVSGTAPTRVQVEVYGVGRCADPAVAEGRFSRAITLLSGETSARFLGLPAADLGYALVARGYNAGGDEIAFGCQAEVSVLSDQEARRVVLLGARVQGLEGVYDARFEVDFRAVAHFDDVANTVQSGSLSDGDATFLLDALEAHLSGTGEVAAAAGLGAARATGLDADFAAFLATEVAGPSVGLGLIATWLRDHGRWSLDGVLSVGSEGDLDFAPEVVGVSGPDGEFSAITMAGASAPAVSLVASLDLLSASLDIVNGQLGVPARLNVDAVLQAARSAGALLPFQELSGVASASSFAISAVDAACPSACRAQVYAAAGASVLAAYLAGLGQDAGGPVVAFVGTASASDPDGDLRADALEGSFTAELRVSNAGAGAPYSVPLMLSATRSTTP